MARSRDHCFIRAAVLARDKIMNTHEYPFTIPALANFEKIDLDLPVTFFVGENGSGKSTMIEAIAIAAGLNEEGGSQNFRFSSRSSASRLHSCIRLVRSVPRPRTSYFFRAESFFNVATAIEILDQEPGGPPVINSYGGRSLHEQSHGESFFSLVKNRFGPRGLYILDEPESALSPGRQLSFICRMHDLVKQGSQFIIATHSPILMAYPEAHIYSFCGSGIERVEYEETENFLITKDFLLHRENYLKRLLDGGD